MQKRSAVELGEMEMYKKRVRLLNREKTRKIVKGIIKNPLPIINYLKI